MSEKRKVTMDDALAAGDSVILNVQAARIKELEKALKEIADPAGIAQSLEADGSLHVLESLARRALYMQRIARAAIAKAKGEEHKRRTGGTTMKDALARLIRIMGTFDLATGHADTMDQALDALEAELRDVLGHLRARREQQRESEWVGLTDKEIEAAGHLNVEGERMLPYSFARAIEAKLKEKNA